MSQRQVGRGKSIAFFFPERSAERAFVAAGGRKQDGSSYSKHARTANFTLNKIAGVAGLECSVHVLLTP